MSAFDTISSPLPQRLKDGIDRLASVLRADQWSAANAAGLNPTQAHVLAFLAGRGEAGLRVKAIAGHLGVSQPTATDSIAALERKGLVVKAPDAADARAVVVHATMAGQEAVRLIGIAASATQEALGALAPHEQAGLMILLIKIIRTLQQAGALPDQRMCPSCRYFRPDAHPGADLPHHCAFVDAAFGARHLRLDCGEHDTADITLQATNWRIFTQGSAPAGRPD